MKSVNWAGQWRETSPPEPFACPSSDGSMTAGQSAFWRLWEGFTAQTGVSPKRLGHSLPFGARSHSKKEQEERTWASTASLSPSYTQRQGPRREAEVALQTLPFFKHLVLLVRRLQAQKKNPERRRKDTPRKTIMQESHQMGLDTRENATPVTSDTGDTGVTSPAELQWAGNAPEPPAVPWTPVLLPLPNMPTYSSCPWKIQTQKLQHDTGILPSLHACNKSSNCSLARKAKLGRPSYNDPWRKPWKGACNWFL